MTAGEWAERNEKESVEPPAAVLEGAESVMARAFTIWDATRQPGDFVVDGESVMREGLEQARREAVDADQEGHSIHGPLAPTTRTGLDDAEREG